MTNMKAEPESLWIVSGVSDGEPVEVSVTSRGKPHEVARVDALYIAGKPGRVTGVRPATEEDYATPWVGRVDNRPVNPLFRA